ncbi:MAG: lysylphosphatidylglycerol synthase domain-containing protein, partial [Bdellovibrionota bacterium]
MVTRKAAIKSVVLYNLVHLLGTLLAFLVGASIILFHFPVSAPIRIAFVSLISVFSLLFLTAYFLPSLRGGKRKRALQKNLLWKIGFWIRWALSKIRVFSRRHPWRFWLAIFIETLARFVEGFTFYVAFRAVGDPLSPFHCALLDVGRALMDNIFFFIPYQVGSREMSLMLLCKEVLHEGIASAVTVAVLYRLVEILWMLIGYLLWVKGSRSSKASR